MGFETKFEDGTVITNYLAVAYAEGFCEGEGASAKDVLRAWSYICGTKIYTNLQGFYGRQIKCFIDVDILFEDGSVNWEYVNELL
jgi:hypothetical protein